MTDDWASTKLMRGSVLRVIAHDPFTLAPDGTRLPLPTDFVMGVGGATRTLLDLTPTRLVGRALDIGCGSAAQTVFLNASRVIATDIDERALQAAEATCHLSGFRRMEPRVWRDGERLIEFRHGSLLDPVRGERFDRIVANPPFVIDGVGHIHRDSPFAGDGLTRRLLADLPAHLNADGLAIVLASWLHPSSGEWRERLAAWLPSDVSSWVAQRDVLDLDAYVEVWGDDAGIADDERRAWRDRLAVLDANAIGFGWIVLARDGHSSVHMEDVGGAHRLPTGDEVEAQMRVFAHPPEALELLQGRWLFVVEHWRGDLALDAVEAVLLEQVRRGATLAEAVPVVAAALPVDEDDLVSLGLVCLRRLVETGYLAPAR